MSGMEILITITGLLVGYWIVSAVLERVWGSPARGAERGGPQQDGTFEEQRRAQQEGGQRDDPPDDQPREEGMRGRWHHILEVSESASIDEIRRAYRVKISQYHPDKVTQLGEELRELANRKSKEINAAYEHGVRLRT